MSIAAVTAGMDAAVSMGNFDPDLVAVEARRSLLATITPIPVPLPTSAGPAAGIGRPAPSLAGYDQLLREATA